MILVIDNYDSFVYNLVQIIGGFGEKIKVYRNDEISLSEIRIMQPNGIIISPGPCGPKEAGISKSVIEEFAGIIPIFGVCLGLQCIGEVFGGTIKRAKLPKHGKLSNIKHLNRYVFEGVSNPLTVVRYHSLVIDESCCPESLIPTAYSEEHEIMGIRHSIYDVEGVQFHPESVFTMEGGKILGNYVRHIHKLTEE